MASDTDYRIDTDSPVGDDLLFWSLVGYEALSRSSAYELTVLSDNPSITAQQILGRSFDIVMAYVDADGNPHERHCQGIAVRFARMQVLGRHHEYRIQLRSWFWLLNKRRNARLFEERTTLEILDTVLQDGPISALKKLKADRAIGQYQPRHYSVQFEESDHSYLSRLLEEEGIYYWFDAHTEPGTMYLGDSSESVHDPLPVDGVLRFAPRGSSETRFNEIAHWFSERQLESGKFDSRDSNYERIRTKLGAPMDVSAAHELGGFEEFEFAGGYFEVGASERVASLRADEQVARRERHWGLTFWPDVAPGHTFRYEGDPSGARDGDYLIGACMVLAVHSGHESVPPLPAEPQSVQRLLAQWLAEDAVNHGRADMVMRLLESQPLLRAPKPGTRAFLITTWPVATPFRPPRLTPRVRMPGPQTAIVVGAEGEEQPKNGQDLYVDEVGRVRVLFHWNRYEAGKQDRDGQKWSAMLRVSQPWAGKGWGGYFAPRIGQEVIVDFINGDPDRPLITGRVYNDDQPIPYRTATQSGFRSRSSPGGDPSKYNEIMFEDKTGEEKLNIHAERDMGRSVERDDATTVGRDQSVGVKRDQTQTVDRDRSIRVKNNESHIVDVNQTLKVVGNQDNTVVGNQTTQVDGVYQLTVKGDIRTKTTGKRFDQTIGNETRKVTGNQTFEVTGNMGFKAATIVMETPHFEWKITGANSAVMEVPSGPYSIMANKFSVLSNTDASILAVGKINQTSIENNVTVMGSNNSGYIGMASETNMGLSRSTFLGLAMDTFMGASISNTLALQFEAVLAAKLSVAAGPHIELNSMKMYAPGGGGGGGGGSVAAAGELTASGATVMSEGATFWAVMGALEGTSIGLFSAFAGFGELAQQYADARAELERAADEAAEAGHPGLAARLNRLAQEGEGTLANDAPTSTQNTRGDAFTQDYEPFAEPGPGGYSEGPTSSDDGLYSSDPNSSEPNSSEPNSSEPNSSEPNSSEPNSSEPNASEPNSSEPNSSEPNSSEPNASEPNSSEPNSSEPNSSEPNSSEPNSSNPNSSGF